MRAMPAARPRLGADLGILLRCAALVLRGRGAAAPGHATMPAFAGAAAKAAGQPPSRISKS